MQVSTILMEYPLLSTILDILLTVVFDWLQWKWYLFKSIISISRKSSLYRTSFQSHHIPSITLFARLDFGMVRDGSFLLHYYKVLTFRWLSKFVSKTLSLCSSRKLLSSFGGLFFAQHKEKSHIKLIHITKLM